MSFWDGDQQGGGAGTPPAAEPATRRERPGGKVVIGVVVLLLLVLGGGYVAAYYVAGDKVPRGTEVAGVDVGGLSRAAAENELRAALDDRADETLQVTVASGSGDPRTGELDPADIGLEVDYATTLDDAGAERSWSPGRQWAYFTGGDEVQPVVDLDEAALDDELARLSEGLGTPPVDGQVLFESSGPTTEDPVPGEAIDTATAADAVRAAFLGDGDTVELSVVEAEPDIDSGDVQQALDEFANPAMAAAVTLRFKGEEVTLQPSRFARVLSMEPEDGELVPRVDEKRLSRLVRGGTTTDEPVDATVRLVDGKPEVVPGKSGVDFAPDDVAAAFLDVLTAPEGEREAAVDASVARPDVTTADARDLGIERRVSTFTTYFPYAEYRNVNIGRAGELIDGTVLAPGDTFSMNDTVGERTVENGFTTGTTIQDGIFVEDLGGGVSQMATTTFNAAFFAGLEDVEHKPHSVYIDRYPVGREATVAWGSVDLRFTNDTDHGVLISVEVVPSTPTAQGSATVSMYSTKTWDISARASERYDYVSPGTQTLRTEGCLPNTGYSGFSIDVWRDFREPGSDEVVRTEKFHTDYIASDTIICKPPKG